VCVDPVYMHIYNYRKNILHMYTMFVCSNPHTHTHNIAHRVCFTFCVQFCVRKNKLMCIKCFLHNIYDYISHTHTHTHTHRHTQTHTNTHKHKHVHTYIYIIYIHIHTYIHTYTHTCIHIRGYTQIHIHRYRRSRRQVCGRAETPAPASASPLFFSLFSVLLFSLHE
jgi:hypothetical protein